MIIESPGTAMKSKVFKQEDVSSIGNLVKNEFREVTSSAKRCCDSIHTSRLDRIRCIKFKFLSVTLLNDLMY